MDATRTFSFELRSQQERVAAGSFPVQRQRGASCFGSHQTVAGFSIFSGVIIEHSLADDGSASLTLGLYEIEQSPDSPLGVRQRQVLKSGIAVGAESGEHEAASVMLGDEHEFVFTSAAVA